MVPVPASRRPVAGDALLHPLAIGAIAALLINDHFFKPAAPGMLTGKLSDFAGLVFFPLFVVGCWELALSALGRWRSPTHRSLVVAVLSTGAAFALVKTTPAGTAVFSWILGTSQWLAASAWAAAAGLPWPTLLPVAVVRDPSDLVAIPALALALVVGLNRLSTQHQRSHPARTAAA
jgi:hypothetical protein